MAVAANGDLFVAARNSESSPGAIVALRDTNGDGKFDVREQFVAQGGTGLALRPGFVYPGQDTKIVLYPRKEGGLKASVRRADAVGYQSFAGTSSRAGERKSS